MITSELSDFRKKFYKTETDNSLTMRPFTLYELSGFIKTIQAFKKDDFPRSQLYQLQQSLELGKATSTLDYLYFRSRLKEGKGKLLQKQIEHKWQAVSDDDDNNLGPWYAMLQKEGTDNKCYETLLLDLIEAYDFIPKPEGDNNEEDSSDESQQLKNSGESQQRLILHSASVIVVPANQVLTGRRLKPAMANFTSPLQRSKASGDTHVRQLHEVSHTLFAIVRMLRICVRAQRKNLKMKTLKQCGITTAPSARFSVRLH